MFKRLVLYLLLLSTLSFTACQKEDVSGSSDYKTLGTSAHNLLVASPYSLLKIEIQYMPDVAPDSSSVNNLVTFLEKILNKPDGIHVSEEEIAGSGKSVLSINDIVNIEKKNRRSFTQNNIIAVYILIADGSNDSSKIFATSYWNTSMCIFGKTVNEQSGALGQVSRSQLLSTLFEHEFGHLLGLVNQGSPMQTDHKDPDNGAHCNNPNCLMYYNIESAGNLFNIPLLDANCIADLKANGAK